METGNGPRSLKLDCRRAITYWSALAAASFMLVAGVFACFVLVKRVVPIQWRAPEPNLQGVLE